MTEASWSRVEDAPESTIETNWLFQLRKERFRSRKSGTEHDFYVIGVADCVQVVAITPEDEILLVRQFRAGSRTDSLEPPGGLVDPGEDVLTAAARELQEETGYAGDPPRLLSQAYSNPSMMTQKISVVVVTNAKKVGGTHFDEGEEVEMERIPTREIPRLIKNGKFDHAMAVWGLSLWLAAECPGNRVADGFEAEPKRTMKGLGRLMLVGILTGLTGTILSESGLLRAFVTLFESFLPVWPVACVLAALWTWLLGSISSPALLRPRLSEILALDLRRIVAWAGVWSLVVFLIAILARRVDMLHTLRFFQ